VIVRRARLVAVVAITGVMAFAAGCGDSDDDDDTTTAAAPPTTTQEPVSTAAEGAQSVGSTDAGTTAESTEGTESTATEGTDTAGIAEAGGEWAAPNGDWGNTRVAQGSSITSDNVEGLAIAWQVPITATGTFGGYASTPIIVDGTVFAQDLNSNVQAIDLESGEVKWEKKYDSPSVGPNGLAVADGMVYGGTADSAFALDAASGDEVWKTDKLIRNDTEGIDMAPGVNGDLVYISTVPGNTKSFYAGNGQGVVFALNKDTGETVWKFETVPAELWGNKKVNSGGGLWHPPAFDDEGMMYIDIANPAPFPGVKGFPWATSRPGPNPDTNTVVKLDAATGEVQWKNQVLPHDLYDWDLHLPPVLTQTEDGKDIVLSAGKMGYVYATDRESGELLWKTAVGKHNGHDDDNQTVLDAGVEALPKAPYDIYPGILGGVETQMAVSEGVVFAPIVNMSYTVNSGIKGTLNLDTGKGQMVALNVNTGEQLWSRDFDTPVYGAATIANDLLFTTTFDGTLHALDPSSGEDVWTTKLPAGTNATVAIAGDTLVTAASYPQSADQTAAIIAFKLGATGAEEGTDTGSTDTGSTDTGSTDTGSTDTGSTDTGSTDTGGTDTAAAGGADGEAVFTANCAACHTLAAAGASGSVGPNLDQSELDEAGIADQVTNGGGGMPAFGGRLSEDEIAAVAKYVVDNRDPNAEGGGGGGTP
jgi:outer membrane protein assembly factor BamB